MPKTKKSDLPLADKIALAAVAVLGKGVAKAAYLMAHPSATTNQASLGVLVSRWLHSELAADFMQRVTAGKATVTPSDEANDLNTREGIIDALVTATRQTQGKDSITGLTTLAKLQGFDKPDESAPDEKRLYVLTWHSQCRQCQLMKIYLDLNNKLDALRGIPSV